MSSMPLTDGINALTAYANETTGASDTTLSDAVESLVAGYGGGGGEWTTDGIAANTEPNGDIVITARRVDAFAFRSKRNITSAKGFATVKEIGDNAFQECNAITSIVFPYAYAYGNNTFSTNRLLEIVDLSGKRIGGNDFSYNYKMQTLILRYTDGVSNLSNTNAFTNMPFSGYNGLTGTLYVPSALVESYKTANNWKTLYEAGHMTILPIEGSIYETQYADGTPIT